jgi:hypothetical protein
MVDDQLFKFRETGTGKFKPGDVYNLNKPFELFTEFNLDPNTNFPGPGAMTVPVGLAPGNITAISHNKPKEKFYFPFECTSGYTEETTTIEFPQNTKLTKIPKSVHHTQPGSEYIATYKKINNNKLEVKRSLKLEKKTMVCQPEELKKWQTLYQAIKQDMRNQIFYE